MNQSVNEGECRPAEDALRAKHDARRVAHNVWALAATRLASLVSRDAAVAATPNASSSPIESSARAKDLLP